MKYQKYLLLGLLLALSSTLFSCGSAGAPSNNTPTTDGGSGESQTNDLIYSDSSRKIIYTVTYSITMEEGLSTLASEVSEKIYSLNGYISGSNESTGYYHYIYKVPVESLNDFLSFMNDKNDVVDNKTITSEDVTSSYNKLEAQIATLESSKKAYENLLANEELTYSDIIKINDKIVSIDSDLTYLYGQLDKINEQTDYATIEITYRQKYVAQEENPFSNYVEYLQDLGLWLVNFVLYTIPFALVSSIIIIVIYLIKRKRSKTTS